MSKVNWMVFVSLIIHKANAGVPEVPKSPLWTKLQIEKPRSSVIPTWYDVLVTPQIRNPENETKSKTDKISYANLQESLSLNKLNLPDVIQKNVVLESKEIDVPEANATEVKLIPKSGSSGTKMKDLFKNTFTIPSKDLKKNAKIELKSAVANGNELSLPEVAKKKNILVTKGLGSLKANATAAKSNPKPGKKVADLSKNSFTIAENNTNMNAKTVKEGSNAKDLNLNYDDQKNINMEGKEVVSISVVNSTDPKAKPRPGTKMKDLFKDIVITPKNEINKNDKLVEGESILDNPKEPLNKAQSLATKEATVPLFFPIFRPQGNAKHNRQRVLEKPDFVEKELFVDEHQDNKQNMGHDLWETKSALDHNSNIPMKNYKGKYSIIENNASGESIENYSKTNNQKEKQITEIPIKSKHEIEKSDILNFLVQAIKNGDLKLDKKSISSSKPDHQTEKTCEEMKMFSVADDTVKETPLTEFPKYANFATVRTENTNCEPQPGIPIPKHVVKFGDAETVMFNKEFSDQITQHLVYRNKNLANEFQNQGARLQLHCQNNFPEKAIHNQEYFKKVIEQLLHNPSNSNPNMELQSHGPQIELLFRSNDPDIVKTNLERPPELLLKKINPEEINPCQGFPIQSPQKSVLLHNKPEKSISSKEFISQLRKQANFANRHQNKQSNNNFQQPQILEPNRLVNEADIVQMKRDGNPIPTLTVYKPDTVSLWETYGDFMKQFTMTVLVPIYAEKLIAQTS